MKGVNAQPIDSMYASGMSIIEIAEATGICRSTVRFRLHRMGVLRSVADGIRMAASRGRLGSGLRGKKRVFTDAHAKAISAGRIKAADATAAGVSKKPNGYVEVTRGAHKGRGLHRVVMEQHIGRKLSSTEHVHHIDGDRANNDISNLALMTASEHLSHHAKINYPNRRRKSNGSWS